MANAGGVGAFTTEDLLGWFKSVAPSSSVARKPDLPMPAPAGAVAYRYMKQQRDAARKEQEEKWARERGRRDEQEYEEEPAAYHPTYNTDPDDGIAFSYVDEYDLDPGNPTNPSALPGDHDYEVNKSTDVYDEFPFDLAKNPNLPIHEYQEDILQAIDRGQVTVIEGSTGSGKSTQVPQFILGKHMEAGEHCNIVCTQPRRIAAKSVAKFVSDTQGWSLGSLVGYQIGMDRNVSEKTRLTFVTTGVLLEKLVNQRNMNQYTHVILDEVHERDKDTDFCLLVVRKLLQTNSPNVKVLLMSATIETTHFARYFSRRHGPLPPVIKVEGRQYRVPEFYLENIADIVGDCEPMDMDYPRIPIGYYEMVEKLLKYFDRFESTEDPLYGKGDYVRGTVLVFLPGLPEIMQLKNMLDPSNILELTKIVLHSSISSEEQYKVFLAPEPGKRKVILATNIAESSITVPDIKYVVDFCLVKQMMCHWNTKYCCLETVWASKASLNQRKGRAGRVSSGRCYRLIGRDFFTDYIPAYSVPEMQRCPIESIVLKCKKLNMGAPRDTLRLALEAPKVADIEMAITTLKEVGALTIAVDGKVDPLDGDLTFVGKVLESLPIDVRLGKLLVLGHAFGCLESCLVIAAALSLKPFFTRNPLDELNCYRAKTSWDRTSSSDCLAILAAYKEWAELKQKHRYSHTRNWEVQWCKRNYLNMRLLNDVSDLVREMTRRLSHFNIRPTRNLHNVVDSDMEALLLKVVLSGAFYPNFFQWGELDEELCARELAGHDPATTVRLHGLPADPVNYVEQLCSLFSGCGQGKNIHFEAQRAYIEFARPTSHSQPTGDATQILDSVYFALWLKNKREKPSLVLSDTTTSKFVPPPLPISEPVPSQVLPDSGNFQILVHHVIDAGHFWAHFSDLRHANRLAELMRRISYRTLKPLVMPSSKMTGAYCLAQFSGDGLFYRAKILRTIIQTSFKEAEVMYIDYGNTEFVPFDRLCAMDATDMQEPAMAFEVFLSGVKPGPPYLRWSDEANTRFEQLTMGKQLIIQIYSKVDGVLRVELYDTNSEHDVLVNEVLVQEGYAVKCEEPYLSRVCNAQAHTRHTSASSSEASGLAPTSVLRSAGELGHSNGYIPGDGGRLGISCTTVAWCHSPKPTGSGRRITLKGPSSPFEVSFRPMTNFTSNHGVKVQRDSINTVVVNPRPEDKQQRLMVAAHVLLSPAGDACLVRDTTLFPAIPGLVHLVCLMFAPVVELRCDELKRQYTGALCGLGSDPRTSESLYPEHDMEIIFDTLFTQDDINAINCIRTAINMTMQSEDSLAQWGDQAMRKLQKHLRDRVSELILKPRVCVPPYSSPDNCGWNCVSHEDTLYPAKEEGEGEGEQFYSTVNGIAISEQRIDLQRPTKILLLRKKIKTLKKKVASGSLEPGRVDCELCRVNCISQLEMRQHLRSERHLMKEKDLFSDDLNKDITYKP